MNEPAAAGGGDEIELRCGSARARIARVGGEWRTWTIEGVDILWQSDAMVWNAVCPILFPVCGWTRNGEIRVGGTSYPMGVHGFASRMLFDPVSQADERIVLRLRDNAETRRCYPFPFMLDVSYELTPSSLGVSLRITNTDSELLPYAVGLHPGFAWPLPGGDRQGHTIAFEAEEEPNVPVIAEGGLFSSRTRPIPLVEGRRLELGDELFACEALCFLNAKSRAIAFEAPETGSIRAEFEGFPHLVLWSRPPARFVSIECWTGYGDPLGFSGDLKQKPSMLLLPTGASAEHRARFSYTRGEVGMSA